MRESEFIRRVAEAESVIRYTFRLEIPEAEQRLKGNLVACSLDQAYRMTESLFSNYWKNRPFHINDPRKELFEVKRRELLSDAAVPELYCMVRKIIGEENTMTVYAAGEYAFFDAKAFDMGPEADDILSNFVTGMDIRAAADIKKADQLLDIWLCHFAGGGFSGVEPSENRLSEPRLSYNEAIKSAKLEELYRRAYKILYDNRDFLLAVQKELLEHETLLNSDLAKIWESCT